MKFNYKKLLKSFVLGIIVFLLIYELDRTYYNHLGPSLNPIARLYSYPMLILADIVNLIIPIQGTSLYKALLNPIITTFPVPKKLDGSINFIGIYTMIIGILWMSSLIFLYPSKKSKQSIIEELADSIIVLMYVFIFGSIILLITDYSGNLNSPIFTILSVLWITFFYAYSHRLKNTPIKIMLYILTVLSFMQISSIVSQLLFGDWYSRVCPGCP